MQLRFRFLLGRYENRRRRRPNGSEHHRATLSRGAGRASERAESAKGLSDARVADVRY